MAPPALPGFHATMGTSDFRIPMPASSLFIACQQVRCSLNAGIRISLVAALSQCEARHGLRPRDVRLRSPWRPDDCCLPALRYRRPVPTLCFSGLTSFTVSSTCYHCTSHSFRAYASTGLLPVPAARLDTRPVASGYLGGLRTHSTTRPCQDAPQRSLTLRPAHSLDHPRRSVTSEASATLLPP